MKCLKCNKETLNENQICDKCQYKADPRNNKVNGLLAMIFGLVAIALLFFEGPICLLLNAIPAIGTVLSTIIKSCPALFKLGFAITAIVLGKKAKGTLNEKKGKAGKILGIIVCILVPVEFIVTTVLAVVSVIISIIFTIILSILGIIPSLIALIPALVELILTILGLFFGMMEGATSGGEYIYSVLMSIFPLL